MNRNGQDMTLVAFYVDDLILASSADKMLYETKHALSNQFEIKDMGQLEYFFGIKIEHSIKKGHLRCGRPITRVTFDTSLIWRIVSPSGRLGIRGLD